MNSEKDLCGILIISGERRLKKYVQKALETVFKNQPILSKFLPFHRIFFDTESSKDFDGQTMGYITSHPDLQNQHSHQKVRDQLYFTITINLRAWNQLSEYYRYKLIAHEFGHFAEMYFHGTCLHNMNWKKWAKYFGDDDPRAGENVIIN